MKANNIVGRNQNPSISELNAGLPRATQLAWNQVPRSQRKIPILQVSDHILSSPKHRDSVVKPVPFTTPVLRDLGTFEEDYAIKIEPKVRRIMEQFGRIAAICSVGDIFGEVALVSNQPRAATVVAAQDCHLMVFSKHIFNYVKSTYTNEFLERKKILQTVFPSMKDIRDTQLVNKIAQTFVPKVFLLVETRIDLESQNRDRGTKRQVHLHRGRGHLPTEEEGLAPVRTRGKSGTSAARYRTVSARYW